MILRKLLGLALLGLVTFNLLASDSIPALKQTDLFIGGMDGMSQYRIPSLLATPSGALLAICEARVDRPGDAPNNIDIVMKRSDDLGETWGTMQVLMDNGNGAAGDAVGLVDAEIGRVWVFVVYYPEGIGSPNAKHGLSGATATYHAVYSDDDGHTWSEAIDFTAMFKEAGWRGGSVGPGTGLQLSSGRLVLPRYYFDAPLDAVRATTSFVSYSDDHGETWHNGAMIGPAEETNECQLIELPDGSLLMDLRNEPHSGRILRKAARSYDGGETWTEMVDSPFLIEPMMGCQASIFTYTLPGDYERHRILFSNPVSLRRENMNVQLSYDGGETWPVVRQLHGGPAAYSSLTVLPDMSIGCLYERGDDGPYERITFARFNLAWLSRGEDQLKPKE